MATRNACRPDNMTVERIAARSFVVAGGLFWVAASLAADLGFRRSTALVSANNALLPLMLTIVVFAVGWYFEYAAAALLLLISGGVIAWGVSAGWEPGVWMLVAATLVTPMLISATLYTFAARMAGICRLEEPQDIVEPVAEPAVEARAS